MTTNHTYANTHPMHYLHALDCQGCEDIAFVVCECCWKLVLPGRGRTCWYCEDHEAQGTPCKRSAQFGSLGAVRGVASGLPSGARGGASGQDLTGHDSTFTALAH